MRPGSKAERQKGYKASTFVLPFNEFRRLHRRAQQAQQLGHFEVVGLLTIADAETCLPEQRG